MPLRSAIENAANAGPQAVARLLAQEGSGLDRQFNDDLRERLAGYPDGPLFLKCIVEAARWAGFVDDDLTEWAADGIRFFETEASHIKDKYRRGFHKNAQPARYLETWGKLLNDRDVPRAPDDGCSAHELITFYSDALAKLRNLDWRKERGWVGAWAFHAAFKLFLLHEDRLWRDVAIDTIVMPMGGAKSRRSFEGGYSHLASLGIVDALESLPSKRTFRDETTLAQSAHVGVQRLAALADSRAVHINSAIYLLGSPN